MVIGKEMSVFKTSRFAHVWYQTKVIGVICTHLKLWVGGEFFYNTFFALWVNVKYMYSDDE